MWTQKNAKNMDENKVRLKVREALAYHTAKTGNIILKSELAKKLFPHAPTPEARQVAMSNLLRGQTARVKPEWIVIICQTCGCSAEFLLGME